MMQRDFNSKSRKQSTRFVPFFADGRNHVKFANTLCRLFMCLLAMMTATKHLIAVDEKSSQARSFSEVPITEDDRDHWSFRPILKTALPDVKQTEWPTNAIDFFVLAKLETSNHHPANEAQRSVLLRRLKLDLLGLPPTIDELNEFELDSSTDAYEKWVERFLASPRFGEHRAQPWLDLARFAETDGFEHDHVRKDAWQYRDWIIRSLNEDLPYDRFVYRQLAGETDTDKHQRIATMFCLAGPDIPDINDQELRRHDRLNELTSTVGSVLLGLQFHCAQCHDHKYDPISQADFYRLRAVFESSIPELQRDKPFDRFTTASSSIPSRFYFRGELQQPGPIIKAAFPRIATERTTDIHYCETSNPRTELAQWLFQEENPLTARVIVNRVWQSHFGRGLFENASDVGVAVAGPTHPELLDWLATELVQNQWSLKAIHRMIVLSSTFRQRSLADANETTWQQRIQSDPTNAMYSRFPRHRMEAETIRDSMLAAADMLDFKSGGQSVMPPLPKELIGTLLKGQWKTSEGESDHWRRSIYVFARRNLRYPIFESFDRPDAGASCPKRDLSTTAIQALQMFNSELSTDCSWRLRDRICFDAKNASTFDSKSNGNEKKIERLFLYTLARLPTKKELEVLDSFIGKSESQSDLNLLAACLAMLNTSEFIYID